MPVLGISQSTFKEQQLAYPRVAAAFAKYGNKTDSLLSAFNLKKENLKLFIRVFKATDSLEVWATNASKYQLIKKIKICDHSGVLGPKRKQGDRQVPRGCTKLCILTPSRGFTYRWVLTTPIRPIALRARATSWAAIFTFTATVLVLAAWR